MFYLFFILWSLVSDICFGINPFVKVGHYVDGCSIFKSVAMNDNQIRRKIQNHVEDNGKPFHHLSQNVMAVQK